MELRASIVIGSGSLSYEMVRTLVERLPMMLCPRWVRVEAQPIGIEDLVENLVECLDLAGPGSRTYEIGGPDVVSYADMAELAYWYLLYPLHAWIFRGMLQEIGRRACGSPRR